MYTHARHLISQSKDLLNNTVQNSFFSYEHLKSKIRVEGGEGSSFSWLLFLNPQVSFKRLQSQVHEKSLRPPHQDERELKPGPGEPRTRLQNVCRQKKKRKTEVGCLVATAGAAAAAGSQPASQSICPGALESGAFPLNPINPATSCLGGPAALAGKVHLRARSDKTHYHHGGPFLLLLLLPFLLFLGQRIAPTQVQR